MTGSYSLRKDTKKEKEDWLVKTETLHKLAFDLMEIDFLIFGHVEGFTHYLILAENKMKNKQLWK